MILDTSCGSLFPYFVSGMGSFSRSDQSPILSVTEFELCTRLPRIVGHRNGQMQELLHCYQLSASELHLLATSRLDSEGRMH